MLVYTHHRTGLPEKVIRDQLMADINEMERLVASQPGMYGRIWYGQGLAFDEAYQILQDVIYFFISHHALLVCLSHVHVMAITFTAYICVCTRRIPSYRLACVCCTHLSHADIHTPPHRTFPSSATQRRWRRAKLLGRTQMPAGSTASYRPANPTTRPSPTSVSEEYVSITPELTVQCLYNRAKPPLVDRIVVIAPHVLLHV